MEVSCVSCSPALSLSLPPSSSSSNPITNLRLWLNQERKSRSSKERSLRIRSSAEGSGETSIDDAERRRRRSSLAAGGIEVSASPGSSTSTIERTFGSRNADFAMWEKLGAVVRLSYGIGIYGAMALAGNFICSITGIESTGGFHFALNAIVDGLGYAAPPIMALLFILDRSPMSVSVSNGSVRYQIGTCQTGSISADAANYGANTHHSKSAQKQSICCINQEWNHIVGWAEDEVVKYSPHARAIRDVEDEELRSFFCGMSPWQFILIVIASSIGEELFYRVAVQGSLADMFLRGTELVKDARGIASLTGMLPLFVPFAQAFAAVVTAALTGSLYYIATAPKDPTYVVAPVLQSRSGREDLKKLFAAWYQRRQMRKIYSPLLEGLLALYLGFEWIQTDNILAPMITHGIYSAVVLGHGLIKIHDHRRKLRNRIQQVKAGAKSPNK
ncbi:uncharacterized protein M6B38_124190 [Iris pallida]|uniref:CAAX prenyl protease 2/Lysostaphin resistance protein A-like domain-containing protein n=1 Tax=Iris pallida TaxID=29817 RepID=A0AAX6H3V6_IRIPA|nr:uncharacterized protein M6B38_124190 [Iris pallida]